jgi:hypothetical protein
MSRPIRSLAERTHTILVLEKLLLAEIDSQLEQCWHNRSMHLDTTEISRLHALIAIATEANDIQISWPEQGESDT